MPRGRPRSEGNIFYTEIVKHLGQEAGGAKDWKCLSPSLKRLFTYYAERRIRSANRVDFLNAIFEKIKHVILVHCISAEHT